MRRSTIASALLFVLLATACEFELAAKGATAPCTDQHYRINPGANGTGSQDEAMVGRIQTGVEAYGEVIGRTFIYAGTTTDRITDNDRVDDTILFEVAWPGEAPHGLGHAEPQLENDRYLGGDVYVSPSLRNAPAGIVRRLVMHEMGHLGGLLDSDAPHELMNPGLPVDTFGPGDRIGLLLTHPACSVDLILPGHPDFVAARG